MFAKMSVSTVSEQHQMQPAQRLSDLSRVSALLREQLTALTT